MRMLIEAAALAAAMVVGSAAMAEEQTLKFKLVTHKVSGPYLQAANVEGHGVGAGEYVGVATFEDGRIAFKEFVLVSDGSDIEGTYSGYSTYTFQNGDSLTLRFTGGWNSKGDGGDYDVLSGTGAFKGATGNGRFDAVEEAWDNANLYDCSWTLTLNGG